MTAPVTTHTGTRQGHINWQRPHANTQDGWINGRPAQPFELEARDRAWAQQLERDTEQVQVAPRPGICTICRQPWDGDCQCPCTRAAVTG